MKNLFKSILIASVAIASFSACKKNKSNDPSPTSPIEVGGGDEENITRVVLILTKGEIKDTVTYKDLKRDGANITIDSLILDASTTYLVEVKVYDDTKTPADTVSGEIEEEANFHRFHYTFTSKSGSPSISTSILDQDTKTPPQPVGLSFNLVSGTGLGRGIFRVSLRHFAEGLEKNNDPAGGEQDILVDFPVRVY